MDLNHPAIRQKENWEANTGINIDVKRELLRLFNSFKAYSKDGTILTWCDELKEFSHFQVKLMVDDLMYSDRMPNLGDVKRYMLRTFRSTENKKASEDEDTNQKVKSAIALAKKVRSTLHDKMDISEADLNKYFNAYYKHVFGFEDISISDGLKSYDLSCKEFERVALNDLHRCNYDTTKALKYARSLQKDFFPKSSSSSFHETAKGS